MSWLVDEDSRPIRLHPSAVVSLSDAWLPPERCIELVNRLGNWLTGSTTIYHRERLLAGGGFEKAYGAPADAFVALTLASLHGAAFSPAPLAAIRMHAGSYSSRALTDIAGLEAMFAELRARGPALSPALFTERFLERTEARYRFAAVRALQGEIGRVAQRTHGLRRSLLDAAERTIPRRWRRARIAAAFVLLRPFDVVPAFFQRLLAWIAIRARSRFPQVPARRPGL